MDYDEALETIGDARISIQMIVDDVETVAKECTNKADEIVTMMYELIGKCMVLEEYLKSRKEESENEASGIDEDAEYEKWKDMREEFE